MLLKFRKFTIIIFLTISLLNLFLIISNNKASAALVCCSGGTLSNEYSCKDSNTCSASQCAYIADCFTCYSGKYGVGACSAGADGYNVYSSAGCRPKTVCSDGTSTCGSCGGGGGTGPVEPPPGCNNPTSITFGNGAPSLPLDNEVGIDPMRVLFKWDRVVSGSTANGVDWGQVSNSCVSQTRLYTVFLKQIALTESCTGQDRSTFLSIGTKSYPAGGNDPMEVSLNYRDTVIKYGAKYCWFVRKSNTGSSSKQTAIRTFTTDSRPILVSTRIINPRNNAETATCASDVRRVGRFDSASSTVQNPIEIEVVYRDPDQVGDLKNLYLALVPLPSSNSESTRIQADSITSKIQTSRTMNAKFEFDNTISSKNIVGMNLSGLYGSPSGSGDLSNAIDNNAVFLGIGSATNVTLTNNADGSRTITAKYRIRINDNFPNNSTNASSSLYNYFNLYSMFIFTRSFTRTDGVVVVTEYSGDIDQTNISTALRYAKSDRVLYVDTGMPTPTISNVLNPDGTFNLTWRAYDSVGLVNNTNFITSVYSTVSGDSIQENYPAGSIINPVPTSNPGYSNLSLYLSMTNGVNSPWTYKDNNTAATGNFIFTLDIQDTSCNRSSTQLTVTGLAGPWLSVFNSNASVGNTISGSTIPQINNYSQLFSLEDSGDIRQPHVSAYSFLSGSISLPSSYVSLKKLYATDYNDLSTLPPSEGNWYDYFSSKILKDNTTPVSIITSLTTVTPADTATTTPISSYLGMSTGTKRNVVINGDVVLNRRTNCDIRTIFLISGNLTVHSDLQVTENAAFLNGCIFVVKGNITLINYAPTTSRQKYSTTGEQGTYGLFEGSFYTDGNITINRSGATPLGTFLVGNLTARGNITNTATFTAGANLAKPSMLVYADPRYAITFMSDLGKFSYSIREEGLYE